jgi:HAD superfamily hydrolase (TIGR01490 family)
LVAKTNRRPELALFDFDGTLTRRDTYTRLLRYAVGGPRFYTSLAVLMPAFTAYFMGQISRTELKIRILTRCLGGYPVARYRALADQFAREQIPQLLRGNAVNRLRWHQSRGDRVIVVSASMREWLEPFCREHDVELLCTEIEVVEGRLTGRLVGPNCSDAEKVRRVQDHLDLTQYETVHAYGDSRGDREMLALADHAWYRRFPHTPQSN